MRINKRLRDSAPPHHVRQVLFSANDIEHRIQSLVEEMLSACQVEDLVLIGILRGSFMFLADLVRGLYHHEVHPRIDFVTLSSYGPATESAGVVQIRKDFTVDVTAADVLLVDDILDTGRTLSFACEHVRRRGARSITTCVLLDKPSRRVVPTEAHFVGFVISDAFVVGYGLDFDSCYRELPYIAEVAFDPSPPGPPPVDP